MLERLILKRNSKKYWGPTGYLLIFCKYSRGQNKVTIAERLYSDFTATLQRLYSDFTATLQRLYSDFTATLQRLYSDFTATLQRLYSDFTAEFNGKVVENFTHWATIEATFLNDFILLSHMRPQQLELGFPSNFCPSPSINWTASRWISFPSSFSTFLSLEIALPKNFSSITQLIKHSLVLSIGYTSPALFIDYFVC